MVFTHFLNHTIIFIKLSLLNTRLCENNHVRLVATRIGRILKTHAIMAIAFHLQNKRRFFQRARRNTQAKFNALTNINGLLCLQLFSKNVRCSVCFIELQLFVFIPENRPNRRFILSGHTGDFRSRISIRLQRLYMLIFVLFSFVECTTLKETHICRRKTKFIHNIFICLTLFPHLFHTAEPIPAVLIGVITGSPRITSGTSWHSVMRKSFRFVTNPVIRPNLFCYAIHS